MKGTEISKYKRHGRLQCKVLLDKSLLRVKVILFAMLNIVYNGNSANQERLVA